ncbi:hypothetical protein N7537_010459 [Penicillium hordei]|uniref:Uncharacterized protein n=1 Tax=Penicillium hordei TaxID=40994 RepID=A0AAD6DUM8_9EURO|nr:uncharacterized protein N7537_010459 [Penicillium hordei]KAJ5593555.1 hypothetical protein N7537_010459 [Penicillium hordei]
MHRKGRPQGRVVVIVAGELQPVVGKLVLSRLLDELVGIFCAGYKADSTSRTTVVYKETTIPAKWQN